MFVSFYFFNFIRASRVCFEGLFPRLPFSGDFKEVESPFFAQVSGKTKTLEAPTLLALELGDLADFVANFFPDKLL